MKLYQKDIGKVVIWFWILASDKHVWAFYLKNDIRTLVGDKIRLILYMTLPLLVEASYTGATLWYINRFTLSSIENSILHITHYIFHTTHWFWICDDILHLHLLFNVNQTLQTDLGESAAFKYAQSAMIFVAT